MKFGFPFAPSYVLSPNLFSAFRFLTTSFGTYGVRPISTSLRGKGPHLQLMRVDDYWCKPIKALPPPTPMIGVGWVNDWMLIDEPLGKAQGILGKTLLVQCNVLCLDDRCFRFQTARWVG